MSAYSAASEVMLRHSDEFIRSNVLFAGDLQDDLPLHFDADEVRVHCTQYHYWRRLAPGLGDNARFGMLADEALTAGCNTLIYYWPKSKQEAQFQLQSLCSLLAVGSRIFIVGENRSGVRSAEDLFAPFGAINKIDGARRCGLYYGQLEKRPDFDRQAWWQSYRLGDLIVNTLPGVFSHDGLDPGSELLLSALEHIALRGEILDVGCGSGVLSTALKMRYPEIGLTLTDVNSAALVCSEATLAANGLVGKVLASDVFSDVEGRFEAIISNPPFHDGRQTSLNAAESLIGNAKSHLQLGGSLYLVANAFLPYADMLQQAFGNHEVLAQTGRFKVYQATFRRPTSATADKKRANKRR